ncbi:MAG: hypothetical protein V2A58_03885 [Planctomycetota bacterium]
MHDVVLDGRAKGEALSEKGALHRGHDNVEAPEGVGEAVRVDRGIISEPAGERARKGGLAGRIVCVPRLLFDARRGAHDLTAPLDVLDPPGAAFRAPDVELEVLPEVGLADGADGVLGVLAVSDDVVEERDFDEHVGGGGVAVVVAVHAIGGRPDMGGGEVVEEEEEEVDHVGTHGEDVPLGDGADEAEVADGSVEEELAERLAGAEVSALGVDGDLKAEAVGDLADPSGLGRREGYGLLDGDGLDAEAAGKLEGLLTDARRGNDVEDVGTLAGEHLLEVLIEAGDVELFAEGPEARRIAVAQGDELRLLQPVVREDMGLSAGAAAEDGGSIGHAFRSVERGVRGSNRTRHGRDALRRRSHKMTWNWARPSGLRRDGVGCCVTPRRHIAHLICLLVAPCIRRRRARNATRTWL